MSETMPVVFFGHGNPMNALARNLWTEKWSEIGETMPRPKAILCVSAHWYLPQTAVTAMDNPRTIHDFGGFPRELFAVQYPAKGSLELASRVAKLLAPMNVAMDQSWGLDHGTWSVFCHAFPEADIPVVQLSLDSSKSARFHYELAKKLAPLRDEEILICGSGDLVHNLRMIQWNETSGKPTDWALRFETTAVELMLAGNHEPLIDYEKLSTDAMLAIPTPDHYLPLLYVLALQKEGEPISFPTEGFDLGTISMLSVKVG